MKKKFVVIIALVVVLVLAVTTVTLAKDVTYTLKGMITAIEDPDPAIIIIHNSSDGYVNVFLPDTFDIGTLAPGYTVTFKGLWVEGGFNAEQVSIVSDILVGTFFGEPVEDDVTGGYFITVELYEGTVVTVLLPVGFPIAGLVEGDTVRFKGSWVEGVFVVDDEKGVCLEGTVNGLPVLYGDGRYAITLNIGDETDVGILLPLDFDTSKVPDGVFIRACGTWVDALPDYDFLYILDAYSIEVTPTEDVDVIEPGGRGGIYCDGGKDKPHPLAVKLSEQGVTEEWVMEQFCTGFGFGEIMLALRTHALLGEDTLWNTRAILSLRNEMGWGQIWKFLGLKNGDEESAPPPGPLSKPDQEDSQPPGWKNKPEKNKGLPPGWQKKQDKHDDLPPGLKKKNNQ